MAVSAVAFAMHPGWEREETCESAEVVEWLEKKKGE